MPMKTHPAVDAVPVPAVTLASHAHDHAAPGAARHPASPAPRRPRHNPLFDHIRRLWRRFRYRNIDDDNHKEDEKTLIYTQSSPQITSHWDRLPAELKEYMFEFVSPLTLFVHGRLDPTQACSFDTARSLWLEALECDWQGNLATLPQFDGHVPLKNADLNVVSSRQMYARLCGLLPLAAEHNRNFTKMDKELTNLALRRDEPPRASRSRARLSTWGRCELRLIYIPMHHMWLDVIDGWLRRAPYACAALCIVNGHTRLLRYLLESDTVDIRHINLMQDRLTARETFTLCDEAAAGGHLDVIQLLHEIDNVILTIAAMDGAAKNGHLNVIKWLHENRTEGCTVRAMDRAAANGHLDVVKWLHQNRPEGCTTEAMDIAAKSGHLDVVKWLHENRTEGCTRWAMDGCAKRGRLEIIKWLHEHRSEGCSFRAMDLAAAHQHLDIVKWLHENRTEGCTTFTMNKAAAVGSLDIVKWLHENRTEGCTEKALESAAANGHEDTVRFLVLEQRVPITENAIIISKTDEIVMFLIDHVDAENRKNVYHQVRAQRNLNRLLMDKVDERSTESFMNRWLCCA